MKACFILAASLALTRAIPAWSDLSTFTESYIANKTFPGTQLKVISSDGTVFYQNIFGTLTYQGDNFDQQVEPETLFDIASLSKVVAATSCVMKLYEDGKLNLDDKLIKYVPQANNNGKDQITIRNLLLHNSGLPADYPFNYVYANVTDEILLDWFYTTPLEYAIGTDTIYSDLSMVALQLVVETITQESMWTYVEQNIFTPLGMHSTMFLPEEWRQCAPTLQDGYPGWREGYIRCSVHDPTAYIRGGISGNAGIFSKSDDLATFMQMMLRKGLYTAQDGTTQRLFQEETVVLFTTAPQDLPYYNSRALGWDTIPEGYPTPCGQLFTPGFSFGHTGYTGTTLWADASKGFAFVSLTNRVYPDDGITVNTKTGIKWYRNNLSNMIAERVVAIETF